MRWEDERYVRVYTRDTIDWLGLSFTAQGLFCLILRKVDRAGLLKLGKQGKRGVAIIIGHPSDWEQLEPAFEELLADGCVLIQGEYLVVPNFIEAQESIQSDAQRKRESRARSRDLAAAEEVLNPDKVSGNVTDGHESGQKVTSGHAASRVVTPNCAVPSRTDPSRPDRWGVMHPGYEAGEHWLSAVWPRLSPSPGAIDKRQGQRIGELSGRITSAEVKARMDRAAADPWWREKLTLDAFLDNPDRWAERKKSAEKTSGRRAIGVNEQGEPIFAAENA